MVTSLEAREDYDRAAAVEAMVDRLAHSRVASLAAVLIVALVCFLPGFATMPALDGDEPAVAVAARGMAASGDFATIRVQTDTDPRRPRGAQWLAALSVLASGEGPDPPVWVYRVPSLLAAVAAALLTWWTTMAFGRPRAALLAGLLVAGSGVLGLQARLAAPDALLVAATTLAAGALARTWLARDGDRTNGVAIVFWAALATGILAKGFIAPAMAALTIFVLSLERGSFGWLARLRPAAGLVVVAAALTPWAIAAVTASLAANPPNLAFLERIGVPFGLEGPPGTYALLAPLLAGPAMTFIFLAVPWLVDNLRRPAVLFALAWGVPFWFVAELIPVKLPHYVLPSVPAIAVLAGAAIDAGGARIAGRVSLFYSAGPLVWPPAIAIVIPLIYFLIEGRVPLFAAAAFLVAAFLGPVTWFWLRRGKAVAAAALSVVTVAFIYLAFFGAIVPGLGGLRISERIVATATASPGCAGPVFASAGFPEESLVLAAGPATLLTDGAGAADFLNRPGCRVAAVDVSQISSFRQRAEDLGIDLVDHGHVTGINLRKVALVDIHLFVAREAGQ